MRLDSTQAYQDLSAITHLCAFRILRCPWERFVTGCLEMSLLHDWKCCKAWTNVFLVESEVWLNWAWKNRKLENRMRMIPSWIIFFGGYLAISCLSCRVEVIRLNLALFHRYYFLIFHITFWISFNLCHNGLPVSEKMLFIVHAGTLRLGKQEWRASKNKTLQQVNSARGNDLYRIVALKRIPWQPPYFVNRWWR